MANTYDVIHEGRRFGLAYVSPHPDYADHILVSVIPLERKGKWEYDSTEIHLDVPLHDIFPDTEDEIEAVKNVVARAAIEASQVRVEPQPDLPKRPGLRAGSGGVPDAVSWDQTPSGEGFNRLAAEWKSQAEFLSSPTKIAELPAYRAIIAMGPAAVPLILNELRREPDHWFIALKRITGADPVPEDARGDIDRMGAAWLNWGQMHGVRF
jgi:hypothetical protein